jgi:hypothetical protein
MMEMKIFTRYATTMGLLCATGFAHSHGIWIEQTGNTKTLFYGEPQNAVKEMYPGRLESIKAPTASTVGADGVAFAAAVSRGANGFALGVSPAAQTMLASETNMEVKDWTAYGTGIVKPMFYARVIALSVGNSTPMLPLDIVPTAGSGNTFVVTYKNQPIAKAKVMAIAPNTWTQEYISDAQGQIAVNTPWRGQYVLEVTHSDKSAGEYAGVRFESIRSRTMLTFVTATGEEVLSAVPPKKPN